MARLGVEVEGEGEDREFTVRGYEAGHSGLAYALDQETGEVIWRFQTVEEGFWGAPEINSGAGLWFPPAIDGERDMLYYGTGNPAPFPGIIGWPNGSSRPGPNLYSNSLIVLDRQSGELQWYHQPKPHDLFDLDFHLSPMLATVELDGQTRDLVIGSGKLGRILAYDRENREVVWDTEVGEHENDELDGVPPGETIEVLPGVLGEVETPMAFADGVVYAAVVNMATPYTATGHEALDGTQAVQNAERMTDLDAGTGEIVALDATSGELLWRHEVEAPPFDAETVVNDLVVASTFDGTIFALTRERGEVVWSAQLAAPLIAWPAIVGDTLLVGAGAGDGALTAFRLGAETAATPASTPEP
ncbi:MAG: PQQ-binding-like beta-propeller repeat protein [Chloroflexi bacterium]|nr:PQQ-binding-like beta-propeller repeat protein [Chloroflexota bacterium]